MASRTLDPYRILHQIQTYQRSEPENLSAIQSNESRCFSDYISVSRPEISIREFRFLSPSVLTRVLILSVIDKKKTYDCSSSDLTRSITTTMTYYRWNKWTYIFFGSVPALLYNNNRSFFRMIRLTDTCRLSQKLITITPTTRIRLHSDNNNII